MNWSFKGINLSISPCNFVTLNYWRNIIQLIVALTVHKIMYAVTHLSMQYYITTDELMSIYKYISERQFTYNIVRVLTWRAWRCIKLPVAIAKYHGYDAQLLWMRGAVTWAERKSEREHHHSMIAHVVIVMSSSTELLLACTAVRGVAYTRLQKQVQNLFTFHPHM
jgi:hypothetical protein